MTTTAQTPYSSEQIIAWLRGLLTIAWADGNFDTQEQELITNLTKDELAPSINWHSLEIIEPDELAAILGKGTPVAENFLRTAVMVAIADGIYSPSEDDLLQQLCQKLELQESLLTALRHTLEDTAQTTDFPSPGLQTPHLDALTPLRQWLDGLDIQDPRVAKFLCKMIPSQCPFERDVTLFGRKIVHIPPLCKINPLYEQMVGLRFRALSYLADDCGEDVTPYI
ncbi:nitrogenase [Dolichospermum sp. LEGE 00240]|jgi:tellurite resistance protein|uniref:Mo-dependent nitrogenase C-terminal domain-containing protein n=1 Tax=Dolichospermum sp. LEGE 00240 TaxID=1828603 RepID=UPI0018821FAE|nr:Mo-dependent nitrogenase C-terminal domain-containing protein [Dolichospermum sp. LEGE 00240]MBE9248723.1 nitrogenase [Dolichospermum sp. LEGE 00240]MDM3848047.1 Mo-dependent nitrogenase C-terminal domain-containing protein [Aphanizomenon gracile PMC638.10]MDM3857785.1 Mo-dependent nitrogenase C-terminal domain-containing protein [Aphanizomenon gracile PMC649.10]MDM3860702.1 Mo-dependent nitrogenase C-terminal domain-containing protein [Aphanizomenon gracile PMC644.10]